MIIAQYAYLLYSFYLLTFTERVNLAFSCFLFSCKTLLDIEGELLVWPKENGPDLPLGSVNAES